MEIILNHCHILACGHFEVRGQLQSYFNQDSIGPVCSRTLTNSCLLMINAKEWGAYQNKDEPPL